ncbi:putative ATP-dependent RNA helicase TDRD12 isoform X2 [Halichondria panicea]|uniref:putative ATP-dependent RNA helicase TDRD12 isoform X2 n=1 Tax=Halichondria panicea TaxID=6063 RepID=UPI00312BC166
MAACTGKFSVLRFTDDGCVWGSTREEIEQLPLLEVELTALEESELESGTKKTFREDDLCLVRNGGVWKRGKIVSLLAGQLGTQAEIFLIDEAAQISSHMRSCFPMPANLREAPPLLNRYYLKGIRPSKEGLERWSDEVMQLLKGLNGDCTLDALLEPGNMATLYLKTGGVQRSFNECLVHADKAAPVSIESELPSQPFQLSKVDEVAKNISKRKPPVTPEVYIEGGQELVCWNSLETSSFPGSVQKGLLSLRFKSPTPAQAHAWPYLWQGYSVVLISPSGTGKTLSYLLPILADIGTFSCSEGPSLLVVVGTSWQAKSAHIQAKRILSWMSAEKPLRCCCTYLGIEYEAVVSLINGVDVLVGTPTSIVKLLAKKALSLRHVLKLVLDDACDLSSKFRDEVKEIVSACRSGNLNQVVITESVWSPLVHSLAAACTTEPVTILTSATEAIVKKQAGMEVVVCCSDGERLSAVVDYLTRGNVVICTSSVEEALEIQQVAQLHSCPCVNVQSDCDCDIIAAALADSGVVVVSDEKLDLMRYERPTVQCVLHYSLPQSKLGFQRRLSLLYPSLLRGEQCHCTVVVTKGDASRSGLLVDLLKRTAQAVPTALQDMFDKYQQEKDKLRSSYDLCYHLKAWGVCNIAMCPSLHAPSSHPVIIKHCPPPAQLPASGTLEVKVFHVSNATRLWVSVLKHHPEARGGVRMEGNNPTTPITVSLRLSRFYSTPENKLLKYDVCEGVYCALEGVDGSYHRVRVLKFSHPLGFCFPHKEKARVRLIDHGSVQIVDLNQLLELPDEFLTIPAQVTEVFLCGLRPGDKDKDWSQEAVDFSRGLMEGEVLVGRIAVKCAQCVWLNPVEHRVSLNRLKVNTALCNPAKELVKAGYAEKNVEHLSRVRAALVEADHSTAEISWSTLPAHERTEVCVSAVSSPSHLYVQLVKNHTELDEMEEKLNCHDIMRLSTAVFQEGSLCAAQFPLDARWYRGLIRERRDEQYEVFFIDHGDTEWVANQLVQPIDQTCLELPAQAIKCSLTHTDEVVWPDGSGDILWDLTRDTNFTAEVIGTLPEGSTPVLSLTHLITNASLHNCFLDKTRSPSPAKLLPVGIISEAVTGLTMSKVNQLQLAQLLEYLMVNNPMYVASNFHELSPLLVGLREVEDDACVHIVRGLSASSKWLGSCLKEMHWAVDLLKRGSTQLVMTTLQLLKLASFYAGYQPSNGIIHCLFSLLDHPNMAVKAGVFDVLLLTNESSWVVQDIAKLVEACCSYVLNEAAALSCLNLLDCLSTHEEAARVMRTLLSPGALVTSRHLQSKLEKLECGSILVNILWNLSSELSYREQLCGSSWWEALDCHFVVMELFRAKFDLSIVPNKKKSKTDVKSSEVTQPAKEGTLICPRVLWSQRKSCIVLAVQLRDCDCQNINVVFKEREVAFRAEQGDVLYGFDLTLCGSIAVKECEFVSTALEVLISLTKKSSDDWWPFLMNKADKLPMFSTDFNRCQEVTNVEEDDSPALRPTIPTRSHLFSSESSHSELEGSDYEEKDFFL